MNVQENQIRKLSRRHFLQMSALSATGALLAACSPAGTTQVIEKEVVKEVEKEVVVTATPAPTGPVELTYMRWGGVDRAQTEINNVLERFPDLGQKYTVEAISPGQHDAEVYEFVRLALAAGTELPTMVQMNYIGVPEFASAGLLTDLTDLMNPYADDMLGGTKNPGRV